MNFCFFPESRLLHLNVNGFLKQMYKQIETRSIGSEDRLTGPKLVDLLCGDDLLGKMVKNLFDQTTTKMKHNFFEHFVAWALVNNYLKIDFHYTPFSTICYITTGKDQHFFDTPISMTYYPPSDIQKKLKNIQSMKTSESSNKRPKTTFDHEEIDLTLE